MSDQKRTHLIRSSKLLWLPLMISGVGAVWVLGTPHMLWNYRYTGSSEDKYYLSCDYVGRDSQTVEPRNGECPVIAFLKSPQGRQ
ncbi:hypothetical protein [Roseovarius sp.]|uniref:hypothetical protein n=1 Tax=Roseovarius sp. TaxID=1486281 RepID=UPI003A9885EE